MGRALGGRHLGVEVGVWGAHGQGSGWEKVGAMPGRCGAVLGALQACMRYSPRAGAGGAGVGAGAGPGIKERTWGAVGDGKQGSGWQEGGWMHVYGPVWSPAWWRRYPRLACTALRCSPRKGGTAPCQRLRLWGVNEAAPRPDCVPLTPPPLPCAARVGSWLWPPLPRPSSHIQHPTPHAHRPRPQPHDAADVGDGVPPELVAGRA